MTGRNKSTHFELVRVRTADQVQLHGGIMRAERSSLLAGDPAEDLVVDSAIIVHGLGGNFYASRLNTRLAESLCRLGLEVALVNTRGHDEINLSIRDGRPVNLGAAFEIVDDCRHDLAAWADELVRRGRRRIALIGHSLGAIKSLYCQAWQAHDQVVRIVALSASRLSYERFLACEKNLQFRQAISQATRLVEQDRGDELIKVTFPFPTHITAFAYRDKYGREDRYNWLRFAPQVQVPTLLLFGEHELRDNAAFEGILEDIQQLRTAANFATHVVPDCDHFYSGKHAVVIPVITEWLRH